MSLLFFAQAHRRAPYLLRSHAVHAAATLCAAASFFALPAWAATGDGKPLDEVVVTASRSPQLLSTVTADMTVIDAQTIARSGAVGVADVLSQVAGIQIRRNGGPGQSTSLYVRGSNTQHTAVFIDGVRYDSQEGAGGAVWDSIPLAQIDRIEVLRGPAAAVYGSDAMAGVVQIFTRKGQGPMQVFAEAGYGRYRTSRLSTGVSGASGGVDYALTLADDRSDGFNVQPNNPQENPDKDGYYNTSLNLRGGLSSGIHSFDAGLLYSRSKVQYDASFYDQGVLDTFDRKDMTTLSGSWTADWNAQYRTVVQLSRADTDITRNTSNGKVKTTTDNLLLQNQWRLGIHRFNVDLEHRGDNYEDNGMGPSQSRNQNALALGYRLALDQHQFDANLRYDDVQGTGSKASGGLGYGYQISPVLRWVSSAGTAFRAPTLYQLHNSAMGGSLNLRSETSVNVETGLHYDVQGLQLSAVVYRNRFKNLIAWDYSCTSGLFGCYGNVDRAQYRGITLSAAGSRAGVNYSSSIDFQDPRDLSNGERIAARSKRSFKLAADTKLAGVTVGAETQMYSNTVGAFSTQPGYGVVNLFASAPLSREVTLLARLNNAADKTYELARGYATAGRNLFVSLKWVPKP